jgi:aminobenzoyl-glutamate utilization protein A
VALLIRRVQEQGGAGTLMIVGASSPAPHHTTTFDIDERSLPIAVGVLLEVVRGRS